MNNKAQNAISEKYIGNAVRLTIIGLLILFVFTPALLWITPDLVQGQSLTRHGWLLRATIRLAPPHVVTTLVSLLIFRDAMYYYVMFRWRRQVSTQTDDLSDGSSKRKRDHAEERALRTAIDLIAFLVLLPMSAVLPLYFWEGYAVHLNHSLLGSILTQKTAILWLIGIGLIAVLSVAKFGWIGRSAVRKDGA